MFPPHPLRPGRVSPGFLLRPVVSGTHGTGRQILYQLSYFSGKSDGVSRSIMSDSVISDSVIPWTVAHEAPLPMGFPRREY